MDVTQVYMFELPTELMILLIYVPLLASLSATVRYLTGIKIFGIYVPMVISFAYYFLDPSHTGIIGLKYGLVITAIVMIFTAVFHKLVNNARMHYLAKTAIIYTGVVSGIIVAVILMSRFFPDRMVRLIPLPILMIVTVVDRFIATQVKKKMSTTLILTAESVLVGVAGYFLIRWDFLREILLSHPEVLILILLYNVALGRFAGLRLTELAKFSAITERGDEEEEQE